MSKKRKLAAILLADIVGYTALMQTDEQKASTLLRVCEAKGVNALLYLRTKANG
ncbi:MAG: hypothetical protein AAGJ18_02675 [Bacteroidota bacterium]